MAIPSMSRLGALKISLENDLVHIYAKWGSSSSLRTDFPPAPRLSFSVKQQMFYIQIRKYYYSNALADVLELTYIIHIYLSMSIWVKCCTMT